MKNGKKGGRPETDMKAKIKKILEWRPLPIWYLLLAAFLVLLSLYPLLRLAAYSVPWYDDYNYGRFAAMAMRKDATLGNALRGAWECIRISWYAWQGTYGSILFMVLMPGIWGEEYYHFGPAFLILLLGFSVSVFIYSFLRKVLKGERVPALGIGMTSGILVLELLYTAKEGLYWYNGGVHYVGMHSFLLLLLTCVIGILYGESRWKRYALVGFAVCLAVLAAGANFVTALQGLLVLGSICALGFVCKNPRIWALSPILIAYAGGFYMNVSAPGNGKRAESYAGWGMSAGKAVLYSFVEGGKRVWQFTGWMTLVILLLMLPVICYLVSRVDFFFRLPGVVSLWSVCLYATGFTPSLYSIGHGGLSRTLNAVKITWQVLLVLNSIYWCGWFCRRKESRLGISQGLWPGQEAVIMGEPEAGAKAGMETPKDGAKIGAKIEAKDGIQMFHWWFYPIIGCLVVLAFYAEPNKAGSFSSYGAYYYIHTGEANNFYQEYLERVALLKGDAASVGLPPYHWTPWLLYMGELSENPQDESNRALADWYDKDEVFLVPEG